MNIEQRADALLGVAERQNREVRELLIEIVKNQITYLQGELRVLEAEGSLNKYPCSKYDIMRIFTNGDFHEIKKESLASNIESDKVENKI